MPKQNTSKKKWPGVRKKTRPAQKLKPDSYQAYEGDFAKMMFIKDKRDISKSDLIRRLIRREIRAYERKHGTIRIKKAKK